MRAGQGQALSVAEDHNVFRLLSVHLCGDHDLNMKTAEVNSAVGCLCPIAVGGWYGGGPDPADLQKALALLQTIRAWATQ